MGNDGGSIPTRRELVKESLRDPTTAQVKELQNEQQEYYWTTDPISRDTLAQPVVSDAYGKLYNKSTILEYLVEGARKEDADVITQGAVKSLKDVVEVKFEVDTTIEGEDGAAAAASRQEIWKCPMSGDRLGPGSKAAYIVPCGHAFSGSAIREVSGERCLMCDTEYASNDVIPILPSTATDLARLAVRIKTLQEKGLSHSLKKASGGKKRKKKDQAGEVAAQSETAKKDDANGRLGTSNSINNSAAASIAAKVLRDQEQSKKRRSDNANLKSLFSSRDQSKPIGKSSDFMTRGFSVPSEAKR